MRTLLVNIGGSHTAEFDRSVDQITSHSFFYLLYGRYTETCSVWFEKQPMVFLSGGSSLVFTAITNAEQPPLHVDVSCANKTQAVSWALIAVRAVGDCGIAHVVVKCAVRLAGPSAGDMAPPARKGVWRQSGSSWRKIPPCSGHETKAERRSLASAGHTPKYCTGQ